MMFLKDTDVFCMLPLAAFFFLSKEIKWIQNLLTGCTVVCLNVRRNSNLWMRGIRENLLHDFLSVNFFGFLFSRIFRSDVHKLADICHNCPWKIDWHEGKCEKLSSLWSCLFLTDFSIGFNLYVNLCLIFVFLY